MASDEQFRALFDSVPIGIGIADQTGNLLAYNHALLAYGGYDREDVQKVGNVSALYYDAKQRDQVLAVFARQGVVKQYPVQFKRKGGSFYDALLSLMPTTFNGQACVQAVVEDITERRRVEEALRESEKKLRAVLDATPFPTAVVDLQDDHIHYWSRAALATFGHTAPTAQEWYQIAYPDPEYRREVLARWKPFLEVARESREPVNTGEYRVTCSDGSVRVCELCVSFLPDALVVTFNDITGRKKAEGALRRSEEQLSLALEGSQLGFWDWNIETGRVQRGSHWAEMLGYSLQEIDLDVKQWTNLHHPDDRTAASQSLQEHVEGRTPIYSVEYRMRAKDGEYRWILDRGRVVKRDPQGKPLRMAGTHTDITERKRAEAEKATLEAQLQQAQKMESVGRLAGGVAHDFNNMLGVILGYAELALGQVDPAQPIHADLEEIRTAATRSADLTRKLLAFARKQTVAPRVLDLNETVTSTLKMLNRLVGEDIDLVWQPGADLWRVKVDPSQIDQILANLCVNARDAISGVGKLTIETDNCTFDERYCAAHVECVPGDYVLLALSDNGCGMDKDTLSHLFEPFFTTKVLDKGTGLGLATVYGIVRQNNGFINVYSEPNLGTTFKTYLPRHLGKGEQAGSEADAGPTVRGSETILLVEDEVSNLKLITRVLEQQGYTVLAASTPGEATRLATEHSGEIHLLMTDVVMPEMNGRVLAKNLLSLYPQLKRLFMSGYTADVIAHHGVLDEGVHFIQKPFSTEDLATKVREALESK